MKRVALILAALLALALVAAGPIMAQQSDPGEVELICEWGRTYPSVGYPGPDQIIVDARSCTLYSDGGPRSTTIDVIVDIKDWRRR